MPRVAPSPASALLGRAAISLALGVGLTLPLLGPAQAGDGLGDDPGGGVDLDGYVVGGTQVGDGEWPDAAALFAQGQLLCTGTLIAPDLVLTAAHCLDADITSVKLGVNDADAPGEVLEVAEAFVHPSWEQTYDVAVLVLESPSAIAPRPIASDCVLAESYGEDAPVELVGYGATDLFGEQYGTALNAGTALVTDPECTGGNGCNSAVSPGGEFVVRGEGVDSCYGDSGGPVYLPTARGAFLVGVVSRGVADAETPCGEGGIYVRADAIVDWIEQRTGRTLPRETCQAGDPEPGDQAPDDDQGSGADGDPSGETAPSPPGPAPSGQVLGGCAATGASGVPAALLLAALVLALVCRRAG